MTTRNDYLIAAVPATLAGAGLGFWMFSVQGLLLFGGLGLGAALALRFSAGRAPRAAVAVALLLAGLALRSASTLGWGAADAPDGTRFKASPVGLSHVLTPHQTVSQTIDCGWYGASGYAAPCAVAADGAGAFGRLRAVYPLVLVAIACCLVGLIVSLLPRAGRWPAGLGAAAALAAIVAVVLFATSFGNALAELESLTVGTGGTLGTMQLTAAVLLCLAGVSTVRMTRVVRVTA